MANKLLPVRLAGTFCLTGHPVPISLVGTWNYPFWRAQDIIRRGSAQWGNDL